MMRRALVWLVGAAAALPLASCSTDSTVSHTPPSLQPLQVETSVEDEPERVWARLIGGLPGAGLTITHQDPSVGIIEAVLATEQPAMYTDCGHSQRTFEPALGEPELYEYETAAGAVYRLTSFDGRPLSASRDTLLDATANIYVEDTPPATHVVVDVRYDLRTMVTYHSRSAASTRPG